MFSADGEEPGQELSYQALDQGAQEVAARLADLCEPGDRALLLYPPGLDFNFGFWGCLYAGVIGVPVAPPRLSRHEAGVARLRAIAANSHARLLLTNASTAARLRALLPQVGGFDRLRIVATDVLDDPGPDRWRPARVTGDTVAYLQYSSGSTGMPRGVTLTHANVLANLQLVIRTLNATEESRAVVWLPTFHDMGLLSAVTLPVAAGLTVWQMSPLAFVQRPFRWLRMISEFGATLSVAPNFAYDLCVRRVNREQVAELDLGSWETALCGAEPIRPKTLDRFADAFAPAGFRSKALFPCYGLAEATLLVTGGPVGSGMRAVRVDPDALAADQFVLASEGGRMLASSGGLLAGMEVRIADGDSLELLPDGEIGEIFVAGDSVAAGYWNNAEATEQSFGLHIKGAGGSFMRTGDLGFLLDGQLWVTGRRKDLIIIDGSNHYPQDIEDTVASSHPAVRANGCAAFQYEDGRLGLVVEVDGRYRVTADSVPPDDDGRAVDSIELTRIIRQSVSAAHNLRIEQVHLVRPRTIPLTSSGKIQRNTCRTLSVSGGLAKRSVVPPSVVGTG